METKGTKRPREESAVVAPGVAAAGRDLSPAGNLPEVLVSHVELRQKVIDTGLELNRMGIDQGTFGSVSCRLADGPSSKCSGFLIAASGVPYEVMQPRQVAWVNLEGGFHDPALCSSEGRMHYDVYKHIPEAQAVVHAHPTFCTALACQRRGIPAFHYMVAAAGAKDIKCAQYGSFGTQELSDAMLACFGPRRSVLLANHGMICYGPSLDKALWLANETECLARQYVSALSMGSVPKVLADEEMEVMLAKFKTYGKQPHELTNLTPFEQEHAIAAPPRQDALAALACEGGALPFLQERRKVIEVCLAMGKMGINQGTSGNASCRVPGGFVVTASGVPYEKMQPEQVVFMDMDGQYSGGALPSSEWRMHFDIYKRIPEAAAVVHAHPTYCTALSCHRECIPAFHYMVAAAGGKEIACADYATFGTQELSDGMVAALGGGARRSTLLANHGMICFGPNLDEALWLANETERLAKQYICATSTGMRPEVLSSDEMDVMLAKFKTYESNKQS